MASFLDVCRFTPTLGGTTAWTYSSAVVGYQSPSAAGVVNGNIYHYRAESADLSQWEVGFGAYNTSTGVLARNGVLFNSSGTGTGAGQTGAGTGINFSTVPQVAIVALAEDLSAISPLRSYLAGLGLSTAGSSATFGIAAGVAADSTNADFMTLASAYTKTTSAWAVGTANGAIDSGTVAASTWYNVYLIKRVDTGVVDVLFSLSATAPTMPTSYTLLRRIGSMKTNGSSQWTLFRQNGDEFLWDVPVADASALAITNTVSSITLTVPTGIIVNAIFQGDYSNTTVGTPALIYSPATSTQASGTPIGNWSLINAVAGQFCSNLFAGLRTNISGQINAVGSSATGNSLYIITQGWIDRRGKDT